MTMSALRAGVIGLGQIGGGVAVCLARAGRALTVYDVRSEAADRWAGVPRVVRSPAEVARASDVVMIAVVDLAQVKAVLEGPEGLLAGAHPGLVAILLSTINVDEIEPLARSVAAVGAKLLDCGVTGGPASAEKGLVCLLGGDEVTVALVRPVLEDFSARVLHMGERGAGMRAKVARNIAAFVQWRGVYESALLAEAAGVDLNKLAEAMENSHPTPAVMTAWIRRGTVKPLENPTPQEKARLEHVLLLLRKDVGAALALAEQLGVDAPAAKITYETGADIFGLRK
jgi:3-hydroxyisobutyrate dehydrogenase-like beta-hydroxyacid dehydrogenase